MAVATPDHAWLPLGNAQIIDWKHLDRDPSARGATAWVTSVGGESTLVRTWCEETTTTTHFEFAVLAHPRLSGQVTVRVARPESHRLTVKIDAEVPGELAFAETAEFEEHPRTGLQGGVTREVAVESGSFDPAGNPGLTAAQVEILEYAPESALHTACGRWLAGILERVCAHVVEGDSDAPRGELPARARGAPEPRRPELEPGPAAEPASAPGPEPRSSSEARRGPEPEPPRPQPAAPTPPPQRAPTPLPPREPTPAPARASRLFASTSAGDSWELVDDETYIGRSKQCSIVLKSQRVSRKHASVTREAEGWFINDMGAANGIWAGTDKIDREVIEDGAEYIIGDVVLTFTYS
jgi:hypothetical protein